MSIVTKKNPSRKIPQGPATKVCEYPWTAENDEMLLGYLNNTIVGEEYAESDGPLTRIGFKSITEKEDLMIF